MGDGSEQPLDLEDPALDDLVLDANMLDATIPLADANAIRNLEDMAFMETEDLSLPPASGQQSNLLSNATDSMTDVVPVPAPDIPINFNPVNLFEIAAVRNPGADPGTVLPTPPLPPGIPPAFPPGPPPLPPPLPPVLPPGPPPPLPPPLPPPTHSLPKVNGKCVLEGGVRNSMSRLGTWYDAELNLVERLRQQGMPPNAILVELDKLGLPSRSLAAVGNLKLSGARMTVEEIHDVLRLYGKGLNFALMERTIGGSNQKRYRYQISKTPKAQRVTPPWTATENRILLARVAQYSGDTEEDWRQIKSVLFGRSVLACQAQYEHLCFPKWGETNLNIAYNYLTAMRSVDMTWTELAGHYPGTNPIMLRLFVERRRGNLV